MEEALVTKGVVIVIIVLRYELGRREACEYYNLPNLPVQTHLPETPRKREGKGK